MLPLDIIDSVRYNATNGLLLKPIQKKNSIHNSKGQRIVLALKLISIVHMPFIINHIKRMCITIPFY